MFTYIYIHKFQPALESSLTWHPDGFGLVCLHLSMAFGKPARQQESVPCTLRLGAWLRICPLMGCVVRLPAPFILKSRVDVALRDMV